MADVLKHLTRILRSQDLNDSYISTANVLQMKEEAHDSGTGSDEEMIQILQQSKQFQRINTSEDDLDRTEAYDNPDASVDGHQRRLLFTSVNHHDHCRRSVASSDLDLEGRSLDLESSDLEEEDEEDEEKFASVMRSGEKRKRSHPSDDNDNDKDGDDREICELFRRRDGSTGSRLSWDGIVAVAADCPPPPPPPPGGAPSPPQPLSPALENIPFSGRNASPRKRYRPLTHRPSLDFYKMQKTCIVRRSHYSIHRQRLSRL